MKWECLPWLILRFFWSLILIDSVKFYLVCKKKYLLQETTCFKGEIMYCPFLSMCIKNSIFLIEKLPFTWQKLCWHGIQECIVWYMRMVFIRKTYRRVALMSAYVKSICSLSTLSSCWTAKEHMDGCRATADPLSTEYALRSIAMGIWIFSLQR